MGRFAVVVQLGFYVSKRTLTNLLEYVDVLMDKLQKPFVFLNTLPKSGNSQHDDHTDYRIKICYGSMCMRIQK